MAGDSFCFNEKFRDFVVDENEFRKHRGWYQETVGFYDADRLMNLGSRKKLLKWYQHLICFHKYYKNFSLIKSNFI